MFETFSKASISRALIGAVSLLFGVATTAPLPAMTTTATSSFRALSPEDAHQLMQSKTKELLVIDVRTPSEFASGHIAGAINIPLDEFETGKIPDAVPADESQKLLYCRSGRRSGIAAEILTRAGYKNVFNIGGVIDWPYGLVR